MTRILLWLGVACVSVGALVGLYVLGARALEAEAVGRVEAGLHADIAQARARLAALDRRSIAEAARMSAEAAIAVELLLVPKDGQLALARVKRTLRPLVGPERLAGVCEQGRLVVSAGAGPPGLRGRLCSPDEGLRASARLASVSGKLFHIAVAPVLAGTRVVGALCVARNLDDELLGAGEGKVVIFAGGKILTTNLRTRDRRSLQHSLAPLRAGEIQDLKHGATNLLVGRWDVPGDQGISVVHLRSRDAAAGALRTWGLRFLLLSAAAGALVLLLAFLATRLAPRRSQAIGRALDGRLRESPALQPSVPSPPSAPSPPSNDSLASSAPGWLARWKRKRQAQAESPDPAKAKAPDPAPPESSGSPKADSANGMAEDVDDDLTRIESVGTYRYVRPRPKSPPESGGGKGR